MEYTTEVDAALFLLRIVAGPVLAAHGYGKLFLGGRIDGTASWFDSIGMRPGRVHAWLAALGEIAAGLFLALGFLTTFAALGFVGLMTVAFVTSHRDKGFFILKEGWEYVFVLAVIAVVLATTGPGAWSIDDAIGIADDLDGFTGTGIAAVGGVGAAMALLGAFYRPQAD